MNKEQRSEAVFGAFDGLVSIIGFIFALLIHHSTETAIAIGGLGGAISATVSMGAGEFQKCDGSVRARLLLASVMGVSTFGGSMAPVLAFFLLPTKSALVVSGILSFLIATWIGHEKEQGIFGYIVSYVLLFGAALLTLGIISIIPGAAA